MNRKIIHQALAQALYLVAGAIFSSAMQAQPASSVMNPINNSRFWVGSKEASQPWAQGNIPPFSIGAGGVGEKMSGSLILRGLPYGALDMGAVLSIVMSDRNLAGSRAGIGPYGVAQLGNYDNFDAVSAYIQAENSPPRLLVGESVKSPDGVSHRIKYDANHVYFLPPLNKSLLLQLFQHEHIMTNSTDGILRPAKQSHGLVPISTYGGDIQSWDLDASGNINDLVVDGWAVPTAGYYSGTVPGKDYDKVYSVYSSPTVWIGAITKVFDMNIVCSIDDSPPSDLNNPLGTETSIVRTCEGGEIDLNQGKHEVNYKNKFNGLTITYNGHDIKPTSDSYDLLLAGTMPTMLKVMEGPDSNVLLASSALIRGDEGVKKGSQLGTTAELFEHSAFADGVDNFRMVGYLQQDKNTKRPGLGEVSAHLGLVVGGQQGAIPAVGTGSLQSSLVFDPDGIGGSIGLVGYSGKGVIVDGEGNLIASRKIDVQTPSGTTGNVLWSDGGNLAISSPLPNTRLMTTLPITFPKFSFDKLPVPHNAGTQVFCSNCLKPGERAEYGTGMMVFDDGNSNWVSMAGSIAAR